ncbi:hypothetical protein [Curtanaerobium respiraculi]|uniref:hypothetical protein n=1 Tax=Curtanaerobium respiraculi TaxID=2949669 RepID=UPI0024B3A2AC|nr:hypothetical protein [Curtanaerobium respiraculi]
MAEETEESQKSAGIFDDLSLVQIIATAIAATTSFLLASQIGIAGSVIGAAVSAAVSTIATQMYKNILNRSATRLKERKDAGADSLSEHESPTARRSASADTSSEDEVPAALHAANGGSATATPVLGKDADLSVATVRSHRVQRRRKQVAAGVIATAAISGLLMVFIFAGAVTAATNGEGIGTKPAAITATSASTSSAGKTASPGTSATSSEKATASSSSAAAGSSSPASKSAPSSSSAAALKSAGTSADSASGASADAGGAAKSSTSASGKETSASSTSSAGSATSSR